MDGILNRLIETSRELSRYDVNNNERIATYLRRV